MDEDDYGELKLLLYPEGERYGTPYNYADIVRGIIQERNELISFKRKLLDLMLEGYDIETVYKLKI